MSLDPYASCPCGSGKKFKWCCQPLHARVQHAWEQEANGQHVRALQIMDEVVQEHAGNPEAWGQKALLLAQHEKFDQAEEALERAFALNPNYPFGLKLRAQLRLSEGEFAGALLLARKASEAYDPEAHEPLSEVQAIIFDCEMRMNRPLAARAALERALHLAPGEEQLRKTFDQVFGDKSRFPACVTKAYTFRKPEASLQGHRRQAWNRALASSQAKLSDLARAFDELVREDPSDRAAWFNLGLVKAWLGDNLAALAAFDRYLDFESDQNAAVEAAALMEVLRFGKGMEEHCDFHEYSFVYELTDPRPVIQLVEDWNRQGRLIHLPVEQEGVFTGIVLELSTAGLVTVGRPASNIGRVAGYLVLLGNLIRFASTVKERFDRVRDEFRQKLALGLTDLKEHHTTSPFQELLTEAMVFPLAAQDDETRLKLVLEHAGHFFEDIWIHRPLKSLSNIPPVDAAGHTKLRKKLLGLILFLEQCAQLGVLARYDFNNLRRKLGLFAEAPPTAAPASLSTDIAAMSAAELSILPLETLTQEQLEKAYQTAYRLDAQELAAHFAQSLVRRPVETGARDRYPWYAFLIQRAIREGSPEEAIDHINEGLRHDCEHNEGKRRQEYELFRAQTHTSQGEVDSAHEVFQRLIDRAPRDFKVRGKAAEAMLQLKQPTRALHFAEEGIKVARQANDRDSEQYLLELAAAARKQLA